MQIGVVAVSETETVYKTCDQTHFKDQYTFVILASVYRRVLEGLRLWLHNTWLSPIMLLLLFIIISIITKY